MELLRLNSDWTIGAQIGRGGMGIVYEAKSDEHPRAVAKFIPKEPGADRELLFASLPVLPNIVPVIDSGETPSHLVIVMPRAEKSLREHIEQNGPFLLDEASSILSDIATALDGLGKEVVHRDIKPENVLLLGTRWCLADFGISRYAEASTAPDTRKYSLTREYAAPEQWRGERATPATDVYALGIISYELVAGNRPFLGPDFRDQHLHREPDPITGVPATLAALIDECMYKAAEARPTPANFLARLTKASHNPALTGLAALQKVNAEQVARVGAEAAAASRARSDEERRRELASAADRMITRITDSLKDAIVGAASAASYQPRRGGIGGWTIKLNTCELTLTAPKMVSEKPWIDGRGPAFDVISYAELSVATPTGLRDYRGRSHSFYYCDGQDRAEFQWFETAFMETPLASRGRREIEPFALSPTDSDAASALGPGMTMMQVAWPFTPLSIDSLDDFISRWTGWLADGSSGGLHSPMMMPGRPVQGSWRIYD